MQLLKQYPRASAISGTATLVILAWATVAVLQSTPKPSQAILQPAREQAVSPVRSERAWVDRGDRLMQLARSTQADRDYDRAEAAYHQALAMNPSNVQAMIGIAWVHGVRHEFERSIDWARRAIALQPGIPEALGLWGDALVEMGDYDAAFDKYQQMLDQRPDLSSYSRGGHLLFLAGDTSGAVDLMQKAIAAGGPNGENSAWCRAQLSLMLHALGKDGQAKALLQVSLQQAPRNFHLLVATARVLTALKEYATAISCYEQAVAQVPQPGVIVELGDLYRLAGRLQDATDQFKLAEAIWRLKGAAGRLDIMSIRYRLDHDLELDQALADARELYRTRRNIAVADTLAWAFFKKGLLGQAREAIGQALRLDSPDPGIRFHAGVIFAQSGDDDLARRYLQSALDLNPNFHPHWGAEAARLLKKLEKKG